MNSLEIILTIIISVMSVIMIPLVRLLFKTAIRWKGIEDKLEEVVRDMRTIVDDKDKVHNELYRQMREDREATNLRLRWLEEHLWNTSRRSR